MNPQLDARAEAFLKALQDDAGLVPANVLWTGLELLSALNASRLAQHRSQLGAFLEAKESRDKRVGSSLRPKGIARPHPRESKSVQAVR